MSGQFLEKRGLLRAALEKEARAAMGEELTKGDDDGFIKNLSPLERSLTTLEARRESFEGFSKKACTQVDVSARPQCSSLLEARAKKRVRRSVRPPASAGDEPPPLLVIIRHGKTEHNKLGLFTGWEDVSLAPEGRIEATRAGQLLKESGIEFDVVYTSWLSRAIETVSYTHLTLPTILLV